MRVHLVNIELFLIKSSVIFDARISFERKDKRCYYYTYVDISLLKRWQKMDIWGLRPPPSQNLEDIEKLGVYTRREGPSDV